MITKVNVRLLCLLVALLLVGCGKPGSTQDSEQSFSLTDALPGADAVPGWTPSGEARTFDTENLYDLVNGQADAYFAYGFEQVAVQDHENAESATLRVEVWQMATPADAYGLFTTFRAGAPISIGNEGDADPGRMLSFWQNRYLVRVFALQPQPDAELHAFAEAVAAALPTDGEEPALIAQLPEGGLIERSAIFFRQEISIQSYLWLGGENLLGLSPETDGLLAQYDLGNGRAQLLLVQYPDKEAASAALEALEASQTGNLVAGNRRKSLLGAVFGTVDEAGASELLATALGND